MGVTEAELISVSSSFYNHTDRDRVYMYSTVYVSMRADEDLRLTWTNHQLDLSLYQVLIYIYMYMYKNRDMELHVFHHIALCYLSVITK